MKKSILAVAALLMSTAIFAQQKSTDVAQINKDVIEFGKVPANVPVTGTFIVKNTGKTPLIIENATPSCGCTTPEWSKEPIMPGKEGYVKATYNAAQGNIPFTKPVHVKFAGYDDLRELTLKGEVVSAEDYAALHPEKAGKEDKPEIKKEDAQQKLTPAPAPAKKPVTKKKTTKAAPKKV